MNGLHLAAAALGHGLTAHLNSGAEVVVQIAIEEKVRCQTLSLRRAVALVGALNLAYFGIEFAVALSIGSASLFADSIDFLEDASINTLIFFALAWTPATRARVGKFLALFILVPALATFWMLWTKIAAPAPPDPFVLSVTGMGALAINLTCAFILASHRHREGSLSKAAFLSARNDALANIGIVGAGLATVVCRVRLRGNARVTHCRLLPQRGKEFRRLETQCSPLSCLATAQA